MLSSRSTRESVDREELLGKIEEQTKISREDAEHIVENLLTDGDLYEPQTGKLALT